MTAFIKYHIEDATLKRIEAQGLTDFIKAYLPSAIVYEVEAEVVVFEYDKQVYRLLKHPDKPKRWIFTQVSSEETSGLSSYPKDYFLVTRKLKFTDGPPLFYAENKEEGVFAMIAFAYADHDNDEFKRLLKIASSPLEPLFIKD